MKIKEIRKNLRQSIVSVIMFVFVLMVMTQSGQTIGISFIQVADTVGGLLHV